MAGNIAPLFPLIPEVEHALITGTTTDKSGATTANMVDLVTGTTDGTKVSWIKFKHVGNSGAGQYLIWITDTSGANPRLFQELPSALVTSSATGAANENIVYLSDMQLRSGQKIIVGATVVSSNIHVSAQVGHYS